MSEVILFCGLPSRLTRRRGPPFFFCRGVSPANYVVEMYWGMPLESTWLFSNYLFSGYYYARVALYSPKLHEWRTDKVWQSFLDYRIGLLTLYRFAEGSTLWFLSTGLPRTITLLASILYLKIPNASMQRWTRYHLILLYIVFSLVGPWFVFFNHQHQIQVFFDENILPRYNGMFETKLDLHSHP